MAQAMKKSKCINQDKWMDILPTVSTAEESILFVKHLTNLAIPTILFIRKILPESEFDNKVFEGMTLKVLKNGTRNANTDRIQTWLSGAYDALEKNYLKSISLEIKDTQSDLTLEIYTIHFMDNTKNVSLSVSIKPKQRKNIPFSEQMTNIQTETVRLLQMCHSLTKSCSDLPVEVTIFMKLLYQQNVPYDYHPFGYKDCTPSMPIFLNKTRTFEIGVVDTNHHVIEFMNKTCLCDESILPKVGRDKSNDVSRKENESPNYFTNKKQKLQESDCISNQKTPFSSVLMDFHTNKDEESNNEISSQLSTIYSQSDSVRCPCLSKIKTSIMYQCSGCNYWVHAECFGIRAKEVLNTVNIFYCQICAKLNDDCDCPDELMIELNHASDQQKLAVKRRLLSFCNKFGGQEITFQKLEKVSGLVCQKTLLEKVVKDLIDLGVLKYQLGGSYGVIKKTVVQVMAQFFRAGSCSNRPDTIRTTGQKTPKLGMRKLKNNDQTGMKTNRARIKEQDSSAVKSLAKKYRR